MYAGVPSSAPVLVTSESSVSSRATPKSASSSRPSCAIMHVRRLDVAVDRSPAACAAASASASSAPMHATISASIGAALLDLLEQASPADQLHHDVRRVVAARRHRRRRSAGCSRARAPAAARASRWKRRDDVDLARAGAGTAPSPRRRGAARVSRALNTVAMPPSPELVAELVATERVAGPTARTWREPRGRRRRRHRRHHGGGGRRHARGGRSPRRRRGCRRCRRRDRSAAGRRHPTVAAGLSDAATPRGRSCRRPWPASSPGRAGGRARRRRSLSVRPSVERDRDTSAQRARVAREQLGACCRTATSAAAQERLGLGRARSRR